MTAFENNPFNNRPRITDPFNPLLRELIGPPTQIEQIAPPQLRIGQGDMLVHAQGGGGPTTEFGILRQRGGEFAAAIVGEGRLGPSDNRSISAQHGIELTLMLLNRINQINTAQGAQPGSVLARQRINAFIEGINRDLHLRGLDLRVDLTFNDQGAVNVTQALLFRWQNDMRSGDSIGRAHVPQAREQEVTQMRERADTFAQQILNGTKLPANGSVPNQNWLRTQLNTHLEAIGTGQGGADRIRLFMLHLGFALRRHNFDVTQPSATQVRFYHYDNQSHSRGQAASPLLTVEIPAPVVNQGGNAQEQGGEQQTMEQRIATLINQNWQNANNDGGNMGIAAQFWTAFSQNGEAQFLDRLNAALAGSNHSVRYDESFHRLVLYNGTGNARTVHRQIDLAIPRPQDAPTLTSARDLDAYFVNPQDDGPRTRLLVLARDYMQRRLSMPGGAQLFEDSVNQRLQEHRRRVVFNPSTRQFSLHTLGPDNVIVNPAIATVTIPAEGGGPPHMPPVLDPVAAQEAAGQLATLINGNWQNTNNDAAIATQFQNAFGAHGGEQFITRLNQALLGQNRSVSYNAATRELVLHNGTGGGRTVHRRINAPPQNPSGADDPVTIVSRWATALCCCCGAPAAGAAILGYLLYQRGRIIYERIRLAREQIAAERASIRGVVPPMHPVDGTTHTSNQEVREPTHVFSRSYPQNLQGNTPQERQTDLNNRLTTLRQQHQGNPFLGDTVLTDFHAEAMNFSGRLRTMITSGQAATPDARAAEFQQFIRDFISAHDTQFTPAQREFFNRMVITHSTHTGSGNALATANVETNNGQERLHIELPTQLLTGDMSTLQMHEVCGSIFDACFRSEVVRNLPQSEVGNVTRLNEIRMAGNTLAYYVEHNLALARTEGEQAHQARINFHTSRQTVLLTQRTIEFNSNGEMIMRGPGGVVMNESAMREAERSLIASEIEALRRRLQDTNLSNTERTRLQAQLDQRLRWQEQMRTTGENLPNDTTRTTAHTEFRRSLHERYNQLNGRHGGSRVAWGMLLNTGLLLLYNAIPER